MKIHSHCLTVACFLLLIMPSSLEAQSQPDPPIKPERDTSSASGGNLTPEEIKLLLELKTAEVESRLFAMAPSEHKDKAGAANTLSEIYAKVAASPNLTRAVLGMKLGDYIESREGARSAPQVSQVVAENDVSLQLLQAAQNSVIIEQNKRIINLLEQLVKKR